MTDLSNENNNTNVLKNANKLVGNLKKEIFNKNGPIKPTKYFYRISQLNYIKNQLSNIENESGTYNRNEISKQLNNHNKFIQKIKSL